MVAALVSRIVACRQISSVVRNFAHGRRHLRAYFQFHSGRSRANLSGHVYRLGLARPSQRRGAAPGRSDGLTTVTVPDLPERERTIWSCSVLRPRVAAWQPACPACFDAALRSSRLQFYPHPPLPQATTGSSRRASPPTRSPAAWTSETGSRRSVRGPTGIRATASVLARPCRLSGPLAARPTARKSSPTVDTVGDWPATGAPRPCFRTTSSYRDRSPRASTTTNWC